MFGHNSFSWVPFRAESLLIMKKAETHQGGVNTDDDCEGDWEDCWSYEDLGYVADPCEAKFFIQDLSSPAGCAPSMDDPTTTCSQDRAILWYEVPSNHSFDAVWNGVPMKMITVDGEARTESQPWGEESYWMDSISRILDIVWGEYGGNDPISYPKLEDGSRAISTTFGNAKWTWMENFTSPCETDGPEPVDCEFGEWGDWGPCTSDSNSHTGGYQTRTRPILKQPQHGGQACPTALEGGQVGATERRACKVPVDCEWGAWSAWTEWTECFGGEKSRKRNRTATTYQRDGGQPCSKLDGSEGHTETQEEIGTCSCPAGEEFEEWGQGAKGKCIKPCDDENRELAGFGYNRVKGECGENCKEGYEFDSQGKCQEIPETPSTTITTQSDKTEDVVEEEAEKPNLALLIGGIAILGIGGYYALNK